MTAATLTSLPLQNCRFERFGTAITPVDDMTPHSDVDAHLKFEGADLRYYVTRHHRATQCLGSVDAQPWWLAVAAPELLSDELCVQPCNWWKFTPAKL